MQFITLRPIHLLALMVLLATAALSGCATAPGRTTNNDPLQKINRGMYHLNDTLDRAAVKPLAKGYQKVTTDWMRLGVRNFFSNLGVPWVAVNELLQGKPKFMAQQTGRFLVNTVVGIGGLIDVASKLNLPAKDEDFGQTLAVWGVPSGPYLVLPFFGPSTVRDGFGRIPDYYARPTTYAPIPWETATGLAVLDVLRRRQAFLAVDDALNNAYDPYGVVRDVWVQQRQYQIFDGNPPDEPIEDESVESDKPDADESATKGSTQKQTKSDAATSGAAEGK